jgi:hypothetical protein
LVNERRTDMSNSPPEALGRGLSYDDHLPLRWRRASTAEQASPHVAETNAEFLRVMAAFEEHSPERAEERPELAHEILRIESKLNLLLDLMGRLLAQQLKLPVPVPVSLGADQLAWTAAKAPAVGDSLLVELYLRPEYPSPLTLPVRVMSVEPDEGGRRTTAEIANLDDEVREWWEKTIFRHHRRQVAHARRHAGATSPS